MKKVTDLAVGDTGRVLEQIQEILFVDKERRWEPGKEWSGADVCQEVARLLEMHGLIPCEHLAGKPLTETRCKCTLAFCAECGSEDVQEYWQGGVWINPNTGEEDVDYGGGISQAWCQDCEEEVELRKGDRA